MFVRRHVRHRFTDGGSFSEGGFPTSEGIKGWVPCGMPASLRRGDGRARPNRDIAGSEWARKALLLVEKGEKVTVRTVSDFGDDSWRKGLL